MDVKVFWFLAAAASFGLVCGNAAADDRSVSITLTGQLPPKCVLNNPNPAVDLGQLGQKGSASVFFSLSCNAGFHFALKSQNGGLLQTGVQAAPPFVALIPYTVSLHLGAKRISELHRCHSSAMAALLPSCSGFAGANIQDTSSQNASLRLSWDFSGSVPLSGTFRDTLLLTVGPDI
jgi:hypothetical protein